MSEVSFRDWMKERQAHFESVAEAGIPGSDVFPQGLHEAMRWSILEGGKRVRPLLCYAASAITRAKPEAADAAALSLECIHSYSLVHDDLPCMDNDLLRHGKASTHAKFGFAEAVLAGDALQAEAFRVIADAPVEPRSAVRLTRILAEAAGSRGMCGGQAYDLSLTGSRNAAIAIEDLRRLHAMKTPTDLRSIIKLKFMNKTRFTHHLLIMLLCPFLPQLALLSACMIQVNYSDILHLLAFPLHRYSYLFLLWTNLF